MADSLSGLSSGKSFVSSVDKQEMLYITHRCCLKSYAIHKRLSRKTESVALRSLYDGAADIYLQIYGLLAQSLSRDEAPLRLIPLPDFSIVNDEISDRERLEKITLMDAYALDLLRLIINRITEGNIKFPLSSKVASLQIIHDRMKELQS